MIEIFDLHFIFHFSKLNSVYLTYLPVELNMSVLFKQGSLNILPTIPKGDNFYVCNKVHKFYLGSYDFALKSL